MWLMCANRSPASGGGAGGSKFSLDGATVGAFATLDDFHRGPEAVIGIPNPRIREGMETEHCRRGNSQTDFTSSNYNVTTRPATEWEFVVAPREGVGYPHTPKDKSLWACDISWRGPLGCRSRVQRPESASLPLTAWRGECGREPTPLGVFVATAERTRAGLTEEEVIGLRLYTGPMYVRYNAALRGLADIGADTPRDRIQEKENRYETTIFVVASGITKLSKVTAVPAARRVYRGLGGMVLPKQFWQRFAECQVAFLVAAPGDTAIPVKDRMVNALELCRPDAQGVGKVAAGAGSVANSWVVRASDSDCLAKFLRLELAGFVDSAACAPGAVQARVVKEPMVAGDAVRMSVALPVSKDRFESDLQSGFVKALRTLCGGHDVRVIEVVDKPADFCGGGGFASRQRGKHLRSEPEDFCVLSDSFPLSQSNMGYFPRPRHERRLWLTAAAWGSDRPFSRSQWAGLTWAPPSASYHNIQERKSFSCRRCLASRYSVAHTHEF